jgi:hypothetical protein
MKATPSAVTARALERWQRMSLAVRLAYNPGCSCAVGCYLAMGRKLIEHELVSALDGEERMYRLLLQTATDLALPDAWRELCLHAALHPLAQLTTLLAHQPFNVTALHARWDLARRQLPTPSIDA